MSFEVFVTHLRAEGEAVHGVFLDSSKAFDSISPSTVLDKRSAQGLGRCILSELRTPWLSEWL